MSFLVPVMSGHKKTERSRREIPWTSAISDQKEGKKSKWCCGRITKGGRSGGGGFL